MKITTAPLFIAALVASAVATGANAEHVTTVKTGEVCRLVQKGFITPEQLETMFANGHYKPDHPDASCTMTLHGKNMRSKATGADGEGRRVLATTQANGAGGRCNEEDMVWSWWNFWWVTDTIHTCQTGLECVWNKCRAPTASGTTTFDRQVASDRMNLVGYMYSNDDDPQKRRLRGDKSVNRELGDAPIWGAYGRPDVPAGYSEFGPEFDGERWAIVGVDGQPGRCVLAHRATYTQQDAADDLLALIVGNDNINGVEISSAFWDSYARFRDTQNAAILQAIATKGCTSFDLVGHSLAGATVTAALADLGAPGKLLHGKIADVYTLGNPRAITAAGGSCNALRSFVTGTLYRFARFNVETPEDGDGVPGTPYGLDHCADKHVALLSVDANGSAPLVMEGIGADTPNDSLLTTSDDLFAWITASESETTWHSSGPHRDILASGKVVVI